MKVAEKAAKKNGNLLAKVEQLTVVRLLELQSNPQLPVLPRGTVPGGQAVL